MTPRQLYDWASENISATFFGYCTSEEYDKKLADLQVRFEKTRTIPGTRKLHSFVPVSKDRIETRMFSVSTTSKVQNVIAGDTELTLEQLAGFITCIYGRQWWLARSGHTKTCVGQTLGVSCDSQICIFDQEYM